MTEIDTKQPTEKTLSEINEIVREALLIAKNKIRGDEELMKVVKDLSFTWEQLYGMVIIISVGLAAFKYRDKEQTIETLKLYMTNIALKKQEMQPFTVSDFCTRDH